MITACKITKSIALVACALVLVSRLSKATKPADWMFHLNNITPYRVVANTNASPLQYEGCRPSHFWGMFRHGTRNPNEKFIKLGKEVLLPLRNKIVANSKGSLSATEISLFRQWKMNIGNEHDRMLAAEGARELRQLGERFKSRFPDLLAEYNPETFEFYHTPAQRTKESAANFADGVFGEGSRSKIQFADQKKSDSILKFQKNCYKYIREVKDQKQYKIKAESKRFLQTKEVKTMQAAVSKRLGTTVDIDTILAMYTWCAFGSAWSDTELSPWCNVFSREDLEVIEYIKDIKHYMKHGYWVEITRKMMCPMIKNVFGFFQTARSGSQPSVKFHFSHSNTMLKFLATLGLYKDPQGLNASNFASNLQRKWRGSVIDAFAANIVFVLYDCGNTKQVLTLHNEKPITLPGCPNTSQLCPLETILAAYSDPMNNCNFNSICK